MLYRFSLIVVNGTTSIVFERYQYLMPTVLVVSHCLYELDIAEEWFKIEVFLVFAIAERFVDKESLFP